MSKISMQQFAIEISSDYRGNWMVKVLENCARLSKSCLLAIDLLKWSMLRLCYLQTQQRKEERQEANLYSRCFQSYNRIQHRSCDLFTGKLFFQLHFIGYIFARPTGEVLWPSKTALQWKLLYRYSRRTCCCQDANPPSVKT